MRRKFRKLLRDVCPFFKPASLRNAAVRRIFVPPMLPRLRAMFFCVPPKEQEKRIRSNFSVPTLPRKQSSDMLLCHCGNGSWLPHRAMPFLSVL